MIGAFPTSYPTGIFGLTGIYAHLPASPGTLALAADRTRPGAIGARQKAPRGTIGSPLEESTGIPFARPQSNVARLREELSESREPGTVPCRFVREPCRAVARPQSGTGRSRAGTCTNVPESGPLRPGTIVALPGALSRNEPESARLSRESAGASSRNRNPSPGSARIGTWRA